MRTRWQEIEEAGAGDIIALFGIECASGDTFTGGDRISLSSMHVPEPVVSLAVTPVDNKAAAQMSKALHRFTREDPTFRTSVDDETGDTLISGMGELHLEVYIERIKREFGASVTTGAPQVKYRETHDPAGGVRPTSTRSRPAGPDSTPRCRASWPPATTASSTS